eukprot:TRINITY_DN2015_c0_g4_i1.p4 TRINITY_DN2015_c0_g4~~TRINITY_DN2015_c0_g4_i1.p4  ORF type:complete len:178 (+),score=8.78 TRINITY_DN2015_c0_g4_i1:954-1487(+)
MYITLPQPLSLCFFPVTTLVTFPAIAAQTLTFLPFATSIPLWLRPAPKGLVNDTEAFTGQDKAGAEPHWGKFFIVLQRPPQPTQQSATQPLQEPQHTFTQSSFVVIAQPDVQQSNRTSALQGIVVILLQDVDGPVRMLSPLLAIILAVLELHAPLQTRTSTQITETTVTIFECNILV